MAASTAPAKFVPPNWPISLTFPMLTPGIVLMASISLLMPPIAALAPAIKAFAMADAAASAPAATPRKDCSALDPNLPTALATAAVAMAQAL